MTNRRLDLDELQQLRSKAASDHQAAVRSHGASSPQAWRAEATLAAIDRRLEAVKEKERRRQLDDDEASKLGPRELAQRIRRW